MHARTTAATTTTTTKKSETSKENMRFGLDLFIIYLV
jgi:hypothetical protein